MGKRQVDSLLVLRASYSASGSLSRSVVFEYPWLRLLYAVIQQSMPCIGWLWIELELELRSSTTVRYGRLPRYGT